MDAASHTSYKLIGVGFILDGELATESQRRGEKCFSVSPCLCGQTGEKMTINLDDQYSKWKESTLKKSLEKFKERKERFETSAGIEMPRLAMPAHLDNGGGLDNGASTAGQINAVHPLSAEESYLDKLGFPG